MRLLRQLLDFYINSSVHVALAVCALVGVTGLEYALQLPSSVWFFIFFGTITGYNFVKYAAVTGLHHRSLANWLKTIQIFSFLSLGILIYLAFHLPLKTLVVTGAFALLTFFYAVPFIHKKSLRTLGGLKVFIVGLVWSGVTVIVPMVAANMEIIADNWLSFSQRVLLVIVLTLPFEIRDLQYDGSALKTLPQQFGLKKVKGLGIVLLVLAIFLEGFKDEINQIHLMSLLLVCFLIAGMLVISRTKQSKYFSSFVIESIPIVWYVLLLLFGHFLP